MVFITNIFSNYSRFYIFYNKINSSKKENSFDKAYVLFLILVGLTLVLNSFFIIYKGGKGIGLDDISELNAMLISLGIGLISGLMIIPFTSKLKDNVIKDLKYKIHLKENNV